MGPSFQFAFRRPTSADLRCYNPFLVVLSIAQFSMISSRVFASALRAQAPALQAVKARPAARIFQQTRGFKNTPKFREPIPVRSHVRSRTLPIQC
jgi:hypothetical protein